MSKYVDLVRRAVYERTKYEGNEISPLNSFHSYFVRCDASVGHSRDTRGTPPPYARVLVALEGRCPDYLDVSRWQQAIEDGRTFLATWGERAEDLGWTARDLFDLHQPPVKPHPSYSRLSRHDCTGLIWLLQGRPVVALTASSAAIENPSRAVTVYRKNNKPTLGPMGDSLDDFDPWGPR